jgi:CheY-like chemotaxis protein
MEVLRMIANKQILLVDDEEIIIETYGEALRREGYSVDTAKSAALAALRLNKKYDLLILDLKLHEVQIGKNGPDVLKHLWGDRQDHTGIIIHSGYIGIDQYEDELKSIEDLFGKSIYYKAPKTGPQGLVNIVNDFFSNEVNKDVVDSMTMLTKEDNYKCNNHYLNLIGDFYRECEERLFDSDSLLNEYKNSTSFDEVYTDQLLRHLHNTKGDAATFGLNALSFFCHKLESILTYSRDNRYLFSDKEFEFIFDLFGILAQLNKYTAGTFMDDVSNKEISFTELTANVMDYYLKMNVFLKSKTEK